MARRAKTKSVSRLRGLLARSLSVLAVAGCASIGSSDVSPKERRDGETVWDYEDGDLHFTATLTRLAPRLRTVTLDLFANSGSDAAPERPLTDRLRVGLVTKDRTLDPARWRLAKGYSLVGMNNAVGLEYVFEQGVEDDAIDAVLVTIGGRCVRLRSTEPR